MHEATNILIVPIWNPARMPNVERFIEATEGWLNRSDFGASLFPVKRWTAPTMEAATAHFVQELHRAAEFAFFGGCSHMMVIDPTLIPTSADVAKLASRDKGIVVVGQGGDGFRVLTPGAEANWGFQCCLIKVGVTRSCPLNKAYGGDYMSPWKCWKKFAYITGHKIWVDYDVKPLITTTKRG